MGTLMLIVDVILILVGMTHIAELHNTRERFQREAEEIRKVLRSLVPRDFSLQSTKARLAETYPLPDEQPIHTNI